MRSTKGTGHNEYTEPQIPPYEPLITLVMQEGPQPGRRFSFTKESISLGRMENNDVVLDDPLVSRYHAILTRQGERFVIEDLGSVNGTFVNNIRIDTSCVLHDGDAINLGDALLIFRISLTEQVTSPKLEPAAVREHEGGLTLWPAAIDIGLLIAFVSLVAASLWFGFARPETAPSVHIDLPSSGTQIRVGEEVIILSMATDERGVTRIELWVDDAFYHQVVSTDPQGQSVLSAQQSWTPTIVGRHTLTIKAYNAAGLSGEAAPIIVDVVPGSAGTLPPFISQATATPVAAPLTATPTSSPIPTPTCVPDATFVSDVTIPDGTVFRPGERIDKIWRIRNSGTCPWAEGYTWVFTAGDQLGAPPAQAMSSTAPGDTADIRVSMYAPNAPGTYEGVWQMRDPAGQLIGQKATIVIVVQPPSTPTPTPSPTLPPPQISFRADRKTLTAGECTTLRWDVEYVREVYLNGLGVIGHDKKKVCPEKTTSYDLHVFTYEGLVKKRITISVEEP